MLLNVASLGFERSADMSLINMLVLLCSGRDTVRHHAVRSLFSQNQLLHIQQDVQSRE
jgi:hypothetical protein